MTDHVIQHADTRMGVTSCSTADGQEIVIQMGERRVNLGHKNAVDWCLSFSILALSPAEVIGKMIEDVPPEFEDARPFLTACQASPGSAASFALLLKFALDDAHALRGKGARLGGLLP